MVERAQIQVIASWSAQPFPLPARAAARGETHTFGGLPPSGMLLYHGYAVRLGCHFVVTLDEQDGTTYRAVTDQTHGHAWAYGTTEHEAMQALVDQAGG
jgi:hypothetical protein